METVEQKLDCLADYEAQRDLIEINKRAALEEIKIPAEIEALVKTGMQRLVNVEKSVLPDLQNFDQKIKEALDGIVIPDEVKEILAKIDAQRARLHDMQIAHNMLIAKRIEKEKAEIQAQMEADTRAVYDEIAKRKREIEEEFAGKIEAVNSNIEALKAEIKKETIAARQTFKGKFYQSIFTNGRVTWDLAMMEAWRATFPFLEKARKEGEPSTQLRKI